MKKTLSAIFAFLSCLLLSSCALWYGVQEDFSGKDWTLKENTTNGKISYTKNGIVLFNSVKAPGYCAAYKDFEVDLDYTPYLTVVLTGEEADGRIRIQLPGQKRQELFLFRYNGVYSVNVAEKLKISGPQKLRVYIYNEASNRSVTCKKLSFTMDKVEAPVPAPVIRKSRVIANYNSASYYISMPEVKNISVMYRKLPAGIWQKAYTPIRDNEDGNYRGSIVNLDEGSDYVLKVYDGKNLCYSKYFRTRHDRRAIGKTIILNKNNFKDQLSKIVSGKPYAWVRYVAEPGFVLTNDGKAPLIHADRIEYVIFDGLTLKGGDRNAFILSNSDNVVITNCNISGWGRTGVQRLDLDGKYFTGEKKDEAINFDGAIAVTECRNTLIEKCFIHDPRGRANSWQFSHPAGPEAVTLYRCYSTVIRYNDFVGSDEHRWNDAVEGRGNFNPYGGINCDADVYGNFMIFSSDDCIELDGGQQNVRCFGNRFEGAYCGVSIQGCMKGPCYVFDNWINDMGDEYGLHGQSLKTSTSRSGKFAKAFIFNNTFSGTGSGTATIKHLHTEMINNVFTGDTILTLGSYPWVNDYNAVTKSVPGLGKNSVIAADAKFVAPELGNYAPAKDSLIAGKAKYLPGFSRGNVIGAFKSNACYEQLPRRPIPVVTDAATLRFAKGETEKHVTASVLNNEEFRQEFSIVKTDAADWFDVTPASGILQTGQQITFNVKLKESRLAERRNWRGAFLIRFKNGLSRPVAVYAVADGIKAEKEAAKLNAFVSFIEAENPTTGSRYAAVALKGANGGKALDMKANGFASYKDAPKDAKHINTYEFTVPKDGYYTIALRMRADGNCRMHDSFYASVDSEKMVKIDMGQHVQTDWRWCVPSGLKKIKELSGNFANCYLTKGKHVLRIAPREQFYLDAIGITDNSEIFINW